MVFNGRAGPAGSHTYWDIENGVERYSSGTAEMLALFYGSNDVPRTTGAFTGQGLHTWYSVASETNAAIYIDGTLEGSATRTNAVGDTNVTACIGSRVGGSQWNDCRYQEIIHWGSDVASNRTAIEGNINSDYLIYQPTDAPTSGLLATYTGAAAAYSVRQLSDKAVICMRIRRDMGAGNPGDDDEINIGFDANGDLDTQAIADFCGTGTGYVTRWWDQSVNGNHADQPVGGTGSNALQPQIYNGTAVIEENGKPLLSLGEEMRTSLLGNSTAYIFAVFKAETNKIMLSDYGQAGDFLMLAQSGNSNSATGGFSVNNYYLDGTSTAISSRDDAYNALNLNNQQLAVFDLDSSNVDVNGYVMGYSTTDTYQMYKMQELIIYHSDESSNRSGIETNIDNYFQIPGM